MLHIDGQHDSIQSHPGGKSPGMPLRCFQIRLSWGKWSTINVGGIIPWEGSTLLWEGCRLRTNIHLPLLLDYRGHGTNCLTPCHYDLPASIAVNQNQHLLLSIALVKYFLTAIRKVVNTGTWDKIQSPVTCPQGSFFL